MNQNQAPEIKLTEAELIIMSDLEKVAQAVRLRGFNCRAHSPKAILQLQTMPEDKKQILSKQIASTLEIVVDPIQAKTSNEDHPERSYIELALSIYNLEIESDFWKKLEKNDVVEVYNAENIQLFRTFNFFALSNYSLLDLLTNEWFHLWERPTFVLEGLIQLSQKLLQGEICTTTQVPVAEHIVKEIYSDESAQYKFASVLTIPRFICPLYAKSTKELKGFVFSFRGTVVAFDSDSDKISVI